MTTKRRVKDLAAEFGVSNKEILQQLREIGVQAKSHMSAIEPEDVDRLKETMATHQAEPEVVERVVQPGVIVRRRRAKPRKAEAEPEEAAEEAAEAEEAEADEAAEEVAEEAVEEVAAEAAEEPEEAVAEKPAEPVAKIVKPAPSREQPEEEAVAEPEAQAEEDLVASPDEAPEEVQAEAAQEAEAAEEKAEAQEPAGKAVEEAAGAAAEAAGKAAEEKAVEKPAKGKKAKKAKDQEPQVRIISMPKPGEQPAPRAPRPRTKPAPAPGAAADAAGPAGPADPTQPPATDAAGRRKRKKDRRVVEFSHESQERGRGGAPRRRAEPAPEQYRGRPKRRKGKRDDMDEAQEAASQAPVKEGRKRKIKVDEAIRVQDMAKQMGIKAQDLIKVLFGLGVMATINQSLDVDTATVVAAEFGHEVENVSFDEQEFLLPAEADKPEELKGRPPVVTIMGHVDHGKTSLLDAIRETKTPITAGEAGGITQHIGAYHVKTDRGEIVFLDTPGHEAFTTMRMRGAQVTDIVILVVAADDGVMDQTREAISHSKAAGVPIVVAVNKIDKEGANPETVKRQLADLELSPEEWGGDTIYAYVSAKQRTGLDELLEMVLLQAEVLDLKANPDKQGRGHIVEAKLDKGRGPVGTVLISEGTIRQGDYFVCGTVNGRVRAMFNDQGKKIKKAGPAMPVEIQGFDSIPEAGDEFAVVADDKVAKRIAGTRQAKQRDRELAGKAKVSLESFLASKPEEEAQVLNLLIKADVQGSLEAVSEALNKLSTDEVRINLVHGGTGAITESDILLASASEAIILGFNVRPGVKIKEIAEEQSVEIRFYDIIYKLVGEVKDAMSGMLAPDIEEVYLGQAEVRETFSVPKVGTVAGCSVTDGKLTRNAKVRLVRDGVVVYTGALSSLKRFKDDAKEVAKGFECGVGLEKFNDIKIGDNIEAFEEKEVARTIDG